METEIFLSFWCLWRRDLKLILYFVLRSFVKADFVVGVVAYVSKSTSRKREGLHSITISDKPQTTGLQNTV
jgi:hypothetical protein